MPGLLDSQVVVARTGLSPQDRSAALAKLAAIKDLIAQSDANATSLWEAHAPVLMALLSNGAQVPAAITGYDFESAAELLRASDSDTREPV
jgi:hypothetical protein